MSQPMSAADAALLLLRAGWHLCARALPERVDRSITTAQVDQALAALAKSDVTVAAFSHAGGIRPTVPVDAVRRSTNVGEWSLGEPVGYLRPVTVVVI